MGKSFYCPSCQWQTDHVEITYGEASAVVGASTLEQIAVSLWHAPLHAQVITRTMGLHFWKCRDCGKVTLRDRAGNILSSLN